jgi:hypothetical protein
MRSKILKSMRMLNEDTVEIIFEDRAQIELEDMMAAYVEFDEFMGGRRLKRLIVPGKDMQMTKAARKYGEMENERRSGNCIAEAMVVFTFVQKMCTNFYLKYVRDIYPAKSFTDMEEAKAWLWDFKEETIRARK